MPKNSNNKFLSVEAHSYSSTGGAYADGDLIGAKMTFTNIIREDIGGAVITSAQLIDASTQAAAVDLLLFNADLSTGTPGDTGDNAAFDIDDADLANLIGIISFSTGDYSQFADNEIATVNDINLLIQLEDVQDIYGALVSRGTPTYTSTDDLIVRLNFER